jgi:hypothetical protein
MISNDIGKPVILDPIGASITGVFGSGVFVGSGKMNERIVYKYNDIYGTPKYYLVHAGRMNGARNIVFNNGQLIVDGVIQQTNGVDVRIDRIDSYAFSFSDTVNYITVKGSVEVSVNAFWYIGEQLQFIDLIDADITKVAVNGKDYAFASMPRCPIYVKAAQLTQWKDKFSFIADWFLPEDKKPAIPQPQPNP